MMTLRIIRRKVIARPQNAAQGHARVALSKRFEVANRRTKPCTVKIPLHVAQAANQKR